MNNYTVLHCHTNRSNATTIFDSSTNYKDYVDKAKNLGMKAIAFTEHGNILSWYEKKKYCEQHGLKYIHAVEAYITETHVVEKRKQDNYHMCLYAKNIEGFYELNELVSKSFNRESNCVVDNIVRYYYKPRISIDEIICTSDNIIISSACLGGIITKRVFEENKDLFKKALTFFVKNKKRCFLEIQHHNIDKQIEHNKFLISISKKYGLELVAGTDTHNLDKHKEVGRTTMQKRKNILFEEEQGWNLNFLSFKELQKEYEVTNIPMNIAMSAILKTNDIADMCEELVVDTSFKYPKLYENPKDMLKKKIVEGYNDRKKFLKGISKKESMDRIKEELAVYEKVDLIDFTLLRKELLDWEKKNGIHCGYGRGSVSGSYIAYLLGITEMNSISFKLNFFRYANPSRVSLADIDTDYYKDDKEKVDNFILHDKMNRDNIDTCRIVTFNTIKLNGAIRDVFPTFGYSPTEIDAIVKEVESNITSFSSDFEDFNEDDDVEVEEDISSLESHEIFSKYKKEFAVVKILLNTVVSVGSHPAGVVITDRVIAREFGTFTTSNCEHPISQINMKEIDSMGYVKLDNLGLKNVGLINKTCSMANIERLTPDNVNFEDDLVWNDIAEDVVGVFQMESPLASKCLKSIMDKKTINKIEASIGKVSRIKLLSFTNGLIRPSCASFRDNAMSGNFNHGGIEEIDLFLKETLGRLVMQEQIMEFLVKFCDYSMAESDNVRRAIAKKYGTEKLLPEIKERFINTTSKKYNKSKEECEVVIEPIIQAILDASDYGFSQNHSDSYSCIGYICAYLRYYYPLQFICNYIDIFKDNQTKIKNIISYANKREIKFDSWKFGKSKTNYFYDEETMTIYNGTSTIKSISKTCGDDLYEMSKNKEYKSFVDLLIDINESDIKINESHISTLIMLGFFSEFGKTKKLIIIHDMFCKFKNKKTIKKVDEFVSFEYEHKFPKGFDNDYKRCYNIPISALSKYCSKETEKQLSAFDYIRFMMDIEKNAKNIDAKLETILKFQVAYTGGYYYRDEQQKNIYSVLALKEYENRNGCTGYLDLYHLKDGSCVSARTSKDSGHSKGFISVGDVLNVSHIREFYKKKKITENGKDKFITTDEKGVEIVSYKKLNN